MTSVWWQGFLTGFLVAAFIDAVVIAVLGLSWRYARRVPKYKPEPRTYEPIPVEEGFATKPPSPDEAAVVDPEDPPKQVYYRPAHYDVATAPVCSCHGRPLRYGEASIIWPIKDHPEGAKDLFCSETLAAAKGEVFGE